jgi:hypothetical protein
MFGKSPWPEQSARDIPVSKYIIGKSPRRRGGAGGHSGEACVALPHHLMNDVAFFLIF